MCGLTLDFAHKIGCHGNVSRGIANRKSNHEICSPQTPYSTIQFNMTYITFNGPLSRTTRVSRYQKGKTSLDFTEARDSEWQWHHLGHMQVCTSLRTDNHATTPPLSFFTDRMPFLPPNQQRQSTEGISNSI